MNASWSWLRAFVPFPHSPAELRDLVTMRAATVDDVVALRADLAPIVVARVVASERIPDTKLSANRVDAGTGELLDVVCGAPNVEVGRLYPFAPTGTTMPGGLKIERRKIRGAVSDGMLCSARELGLGESHEGILALDLDVATGTPLLAAMAIGDTRLVVDVLPNRADLLSHVGLAREIAAATGLPLALPEIPGAPPTATLAPMREAPVQVTVEDVEGAPRYCGLEIHGVAVGPSPQWLVERLEAVGTRSVNNVVDATNYVMHELGQPLHAFDADRLAGGRIVVRRARAGERLVTLDGTARALTPDMTVIADGEQVAAVAGVMGGRESEVTAGTTSLFVESASFDAARVRRTRRALGLATDASYRFERGVDPELARFALERAAKVIVAVAGGAIGAGVMDVYPSPAPERTLALRPSRVSRLLGVEVAAEEIGRLLLPVGFGVRADDADLLDVAVPSWRSDVIHEIDLVEEVARLRGYETFPDELRPYRPSAAPDDPHVAVARRLRDALAGLGLLEVRPMPFVPATGDGGGQLRVTNPLAENEAYLRTSLLESLARRAEHNLAHMVGDVRLYEIGTAFLPDASVRSPAGHALPREEQRIAALVMGRRRPAHFTEPEPPAWDAWDARALAEVVLATAWPGRVASFDAGAGSTGWTLAIDGEPVGAVTRVAIDAPVWAADAWGVEVRLATVDSRPVAPAGANAHVASGARPAGPPVVARYRPLPTTPAAEFDLALLVPESVAAARVEEVLRTTGGELMERLELLSEFRGGSVEAGMRSLAWRLTFRHPERTLGGKEVEGRRTALLKRLEKDLGIRPRQ